MDKRMDRLSAVNRRVVGSSPTGGAKSFYITNFRRILGACFGAIFDRCCGLVVVVSTKVTTGPRKCRHVKHSGLSLSVTVRAKQHAFLCFFEQLFKRSREPAPARPKRLPVWLNVMKFKSPDTPIVSATLAPAATRLNEHPLQIPASFRDGLTPAPLATETFMRRLKHELGHPMRAAGPYDRLAHVVT